MNKDSIWKEACEIGSVVAQYVSNNVTLKNRVFQELSGRGDIRQGPTDEELRITYAGKHKPEYRP
ncbi:MAG: hypothetical protein WAM14_14685 [Candidatus Nitrosopolaris sp.]